MTVWSFESCLLVRDPDKTCHWGQYLPDSKSIRPYYGVLTVWLWSYPAQDMISQYQCIDFAPFVSRVLWWLCMYDSEFIIITEFDPRSLVLFVGVPLSNLIAYLLVRVGLPFARSSPLHSWWIRREENPRYSTPHPDVSNSEDRCLFSVNSVNATV